MFKISPIQNPKIQEEYALLCGTQYRANTFAYSMNDAESGNLMGFSQFEINEKGGFLFDLRLTEEYAEDYEAIFILGRATMNFIDLCGVHTLTAAPESANETILKAIGLKLNDDGNYFCDMTGFFDGSHCSGHTK